MKIWGVRLFGVRRSLAAALAVLGEAAAPAQSSTLRSEGARPERA
jgi:hypothetical protein